MSNPVAFRLPPDLNEKAHPDVVEALLNHDLEIVDLQAAIPKLKSQIDTMQSGTTGSGSTTENITEYSETIIETSPTIGFVNNQTGNTSYSTLPSDNGSLIVLNDASPIAVSLSTQSTSPAIQVPWWAVFLNLGSGTATLTPASGTISYAGSLGAASFSLASGNFALVYFDGTNFWAALAVSSGGGAATLDFSQTFELMGA